MIWRDLIFDYLWERASPLGRLLIIAVVLGDSKSGIWRDASALLQWALWMQG